MNKNLDHIEAQLRNLFEEKLVKIFTGHLPQHAITEDLVSVMRDHLNPGPNGVTYAPDHFILHVSPEDLVEWQIHHDILERIFSSLYESGKAEGLAFVKPPTIDIQPEPKILKDEFYISASISPASPSLKDTAAMTQSEQSQTIIKIPKGASMVIGGVTNYPLEKSVVNIGRHSENDLILDDAHVSRHHAQLRVINDHFVIFDVGSTGGIFLNSKKITQASLQAGDVIRIGVVNLIYIQDTTSANSTTAMPADAANDLPGGKHE